MLETIMTQDKNKKFKNNWESINIQNWIGNKQPEHITDKWKQQNYIYYLFSKRNPGLDDHTYKFFNTKVEIVPIFQKLIKKSETGQTSRFDIYKNFIYIIWVSIISFSCLLTMLMLIFPIKKHNL